MDERDDYVEIDPAYATFDAQHWFHVVKNFLILVVPVGVAVLVGGMFVSLIGDIRNDASARSPYGAHKVWLRSNQEGPPGEVNLEQSGPDW